MRRKESEWRVFWLAAAITIAAFFVMLTGCASVQHDPLYDGVVPSDGGDSATYIRVTVLNTRVHDLSDPLFYLVGSGWHSLGVIGGPNGKVVRFIDTAWFGPDGCAVIVAHYVGEGDVTLPKFCWSPGFVVDASLNEIFSTSTAWAHR